MKSTLVIMGSHPKTRDEFDWNRTDCDVLVFNEACSQAWCKRADKVLQLHKPVIWKNPGNRSDPHHYEWLKSGKTPVIYMQADYLEVPKCKKYPLDAVLKIGRRYLTCSAAFAVALGIVEGYQNIEIYGIELETQTEYVYQRPGLLYWIGIADAKGIKVDYHGSILTSPLYGYEGDIRWGYEFFDQRIAELQIKSDEGKAIYNAAKVEADKIITEFDLHGTNPDGVIKAIQNCVELAAQFGVPDGAREEVARYKKKADDMIAASGDFLFSRQEFEHSYASFTKQKQDAIIDATNLARKCSEAFKEIRLTNNKRKRIERMNKFMMMIDEYTKKSVFVGAYDGAAKENTYLMKKLDELIRMAGGEKSQEIMVAEMAVAK